MNVKWDHIPQTKKIHAQLQSSDTETQTFGCRHTNPSICRNNDMADICSFTRPDGICHAPPKSWPKQYRKLLNERNDQNSA